MPLAVVARKVIKISNRADYVDDRHFECFYISSAITRLGSPHDQSRHRLCTRLRLVRWIARTS